MFKVNNKATRTKSWAKTFFGGKRHLERSIIKILEIIGVESS